MPDFPRVQKQVVVIIVVALVTGLTTMYVTNILPSLFPGISFIQSIAPVTPIAGVLLIEYLGFKFLHTMWTKRRAFQTKFQDRAYQHSLHYMFVGVTFEFTVITRIYLPVPTFENLGQLLATPLLSFISSWEPVTSIIRVITGLTFFAIGITLFYRSVVSFGLDYLFYLYLYFPEESQVQHHGIYSVVRHPTYLSFILMCVGGALFWLSAYSLLFCAIVIVRWVYHVNFIEEKELIQRFGESYKQYRQSIPAFIVAPKSLREFFRFLRGSSN